MQILFLFRRRLSLGHVDESQQTGVACLVALLSRHCRHKRLGTVHPVGTRRPVFDLMRPHRSADSGSAVTYLFFAQIALQRYLAVMVGTDIGNLGTIEDDSSCLV